MFLNLIPSKTQVLLVEDVSMIRLGIQAMLRDFTAIEIIGECENGQQAIGFLEAIYSSEPTPALAHQLLPDVILMDLEMPVLDGIEATRLIKLRYPGIKILVLTSHQDADNVLPALAAGADGYTVKNASPETLANMIEATANGASWFSPEVASLVRSQIQQKSPQHYLSSLIGFSETRETTNPYGLTPKEQEVLELVVSGQSNNEIANTLFISINTAKAHVGRLIEKMMVNDRVQVAVKAVQEGLIQQNQVSAPHPKLKQFDG